MSINTSPMVPSTKMLSLPFAESWTVTSLFLIWSEVAAKLMFDVAGVPVALPGRIEIYPGVVGLMIVRLNTTDVAVVGTTNAVTGSAFPGGRVRTGPVTCSNCATLDVNGPARPTSVRVSRMRAGVIPTNEDGAVSAALTMASPPAPSVTATAAPTAAQRERHTPDRTFDVFFIRFPRFKMSVNRMAHTVVMIPQ